MGAKQNKWTPAFVANLKAALERRALNAHQLSLRLRSFKHPLVTTNLRPGPQSISNWLSANGPRPEFLRLLSVFLRTSGDARIPVSAAVIEEMEHAIFFEAPQEFLDAFVPEIEAVVTECPDALTRRSAIISSRALLEASFTAIRKARTEIRRLQIDLHRNPEKARRLLQERMSNAGQPNEKMSKEIDTHVERICADVFLERWPGRIHVRGEESLVDEKWQFRTGALLDVVDGTDLIESEIDLWCSAIVLLDTDPARPRVISAAVGVPSGSIYYADNGASRVRPFRGAPRRLSGPSTTSISELAHIAYYGQKPRNFGVLLESIRFVQHLQKVASSSRSTPMRVYNFGGNPFLVKVADRIKDAQGRVIAGGIDAVFEIAGQKAHDFVPGAYIALKAGAKMWDITDNRAVTEEMLAAWCLSPNERRRYVVAGTELLAKTLADELRAPDA